MTGATGPPVPIRWPSGSLTRNGSRATAAVNRARATAARVAEPAAAATSGQRSASIVQGSARCVLMLVT